MRQNIGIWFKPEEKTIVIENIGHILHNLKKQYRMGDEQNILIDKQHYANFSVLLQF
jgi:hypothetical protein